LKELEYPFDKDLIISKKRRLKKELLSGNTSFVKKRIAILGGSTTASIKDTLELFLLNYGIEPEFYESEYNRYFEDGVFSNEELDAFNPEIVYVFTTVRNIIRWPLISEGSDTVDEILAAEISKYNKIWKSLYDRFSCSIIQNNFEMPTYRLMGNYDAVDARGAVNYVMRLNMKFSEAAAENAFLNLLDLNYISADFGLSKWHDATYWYSYKYAMNPEAVIDVAFNAACIIKSLLGKNKKVMALDLDNTLWGGVIGDDGVDNIAIGPEVPSGQAYSDFQEYVKKHTELGILLTIDSKNDYENAVSGFEHPDSILKKDDFVCIKANWDPKDINLKLTADELSLGADSFVFVDDNPAERMIVSENVNGAGVPDIGKVTDYIKVLSHCGYFEMTSLSADDSKRNEMYKENAKRSELSASFSDYSEYLDALQMKAEIEPFSPVYMSRIAQLTNKSNQFNLTTKRYTQEEIESEASKPETVSLYGKLIDKFGDNGVVSVAMGHIENDRCYIDLWLMSCRVLKRDMEYAMMDQFISICKNRGVHSIIGVYYPTAKNGMVKNFYKDMGYSAVSESEDSTVWELNITGDIPLKNTHIEIRK